MKKILNDPYAYVAEMLEGLVLAHPEYYERAGTDGRVIKRPGAPTPGKVGIVSGGGSGHLPIFTGYVGKGLLDACAIGEVFASPSVDQMADAMRAANGGAGVLRLYGNYGGDCMNFDMAGDMLEMEDVPSTTVLLADDVASAPTAEAEKRRGVAGMVYAFKIAGAAAETRARPRRGHRASRRRRRMPCRIDRRGADAVHRAAGGPARPSPSPRTRWRWAWASTASPACGAASCARPMRSPPRCWTCCWRTCRWRAATACRCW